MQNCTALRFHLRTELNVGRGRNRQRRKSRRIMHRSSRKTRGRIIRWSSEKEEGMEGGQKEEKVNEG
jgi:hypothetical protein